MQIQTQLLIPANEVMTNFCYAYAKALLAKLKKLRDEDKFWDLGNTEVQKNRLFSYQVTKIAVLVIDKLCEHIGHDSIFFNQRTAPNFVDDLVATAEEFLAIFKV